MIQSNRERYIVGDIINPVHLICGACSGGHGQNTIASYNMIDRSIGGRHVNEKSIEISRRFFFLIVEDLSVCL